MLNPLIIKSMAESYTDESIEGAGAVKGKNCTISDISYDGEKTVVTFKWTLDSGSVQTDTMTVKDGESAYKIAVRLGYIGTEAEWLESLKGDSAYDIAVQEGFVGTKAEWIASLKGEKGDTGASVVKAEFDADGKLVFTLNDEEGTELPPVEMPPSKVEISKEPGNVAENKPDGFYVPKGAVEISKETGNAIEAKEDGLYVEKTDTTKFVQAEEGKGLSTNDLTDELKNQYDKAQKNVQADWNQTDNTQDDFIKNKPTVYGISTDERNILKEGTDGELFVPAVDNQIQADWNQNDDSKVDFIKNKPEIPDPVEIVTEFSEEPSDEKVPSEKLVKDTFNATEKKIDEIQLYKFPNAVIHGEPTINNGQVSDFTAQNYLAFPFLVDFKNRPFEINMAFTTGADVSNQHNIIDGVFGLAFAVQNSRFVLALSSNGTSWNIGAFTGTHAVTANTNYYVKLTWDGATYKMAYSLDKETWVDDISTASALSLYPVQMYIGIGEVGKANPKPFNGIINMNESNVYINGNLVWQGMDDVGLASRMATDMSNIDGAGIEAIKEIIATEDYAKVEALEDYVKISQGEEYKGKALVVDDEGNVAPSDIEIESPSWTGTKAEFEALDKSTLKDGQQVNITDDSDKSLIDDSKTTTENVWSAKKVNDSLVDIDADNVNITKEDDTKKSLQAMYEDGELGGGGGSDDYSTEEKVIGKWIDGKPIYRKCGFKASLPANTNNTLDTQLKHGYVDAVIKIGGSCLQSSTTNILPITGYTADNYRVAMICNSDGLTMLSTQYALTNVYWWIEYTKTTD